MVLCKQEFVNNGTTTHWDKGRTGQFLINTGTYHYTIFIGKDATFGAYLALGDIGADAGRPIILTECPGQAGRMMVRELGPANLLIN